MSTPTNPFTLADWRRTVTELYAQVRRTSDPRQAWQLFLTQRNQLFRSHPQTPLDAQQLAAFDGLPFYDYDPAFRVIGRLDWQVARETLCVELGDDGRFTYTRIAYIHFTLHGIPQQLSLFWINGYGGGLFLPFKDATSNKTTYGGGRYLYDSIKGADLGASEAEITLDFNFAYNPSCAYNHQWVCPLSPVENSLSLAIKAGEKSL